MNTISSSFCLAILLSLCLSQSSAQTTDFIAQTCRNGKVLYKDLCETTLRSDPSSRGADIHGLARIALSAASRDVEAVKEEVDKLVKSSSDGKTRKALEDCAEMYAVAGDELAQSIPAMEARQHGEVNAHVSAAMTNADSCEGGFEPGKSRLTKANEDFGHLCSNVLAVCGIAGSA